MDLYNADFVKPTRNPLPSIQPSYKINKSDQRFRSVDKGNPKVAASGSLKHPDISISDGLGLEEMSDNENRGYSKGSINDVPPTCDTSKNSFNKSRHKKSLKRSPQRENSKERRSSPKKVKSENPSVLRELLSKQGNATPFGKTSQNLKPTVPEVRPPKISAKCWALMDAKTGDIIGTKKGTKKREIASLTKMMTCLCVCKLIRQYGINPKSIYIQVSKCASSVGGTSAHLQHKDILSIWDLMHGLMLPSGNDAAMSLAESFGSYIYLKSEKCKQRTKLDPLHTTKKVKNAVKYFLNLMNKTAVELELKNTYYANPHGLINTDSYSTAGDQAKLTLEVLKMELIKEIVNKTEYLCEIEHPDGSVRTARWENTNKLLGRKGWFGVKTGVTTAAGPSLSAYYQHENDMYIIILLNSATMDLRWLEAIKLVDWANKHKGQKNLVF